MNEEIVAFRRLGRDDSILAVIVDGEPNATDDPTKNPATECFPPALRFRLGPTGQADGSRTEPVAADARPQGDGRDNALLKTVAGVLGIPYDSLKQREVEAERRRARVARTIAGGMGLLAIAAVAGGIVAWQQAQMSEQRRQQALNALRLSAQAGSRQSLQIGKPEAATEAYSSFVDEAGSAELLTPVDRFLLAEAARSNAVLYQENIGGNVAFSADGQHILGNRDLETYTYDPPVLFDAIKVGQGIEGPHDTNLPIFDPTKYQNIFGISVFAVETGGGQVAMARGDHLVIWSRDTGAIEVALPRRVGCKTLSFHPGGRWLGCFANGEAYVLDTTLPAAQRQMIHLNSQTNNQSIMEWVPKRDQIISISLRGEVVLFDLVNQVSIARTTLSEITNTKIVRTSFGDDERFGIATDREAVIIDSRTLRPLQRLRNPDPIIDFCLNPLDGRALSLSANTLRIWRIDDAIILSTSSLSGSDGDRACFTPDGTQILTRSSFYQFRHGITGRLISVPGAEIAGSFDVQPDLDAILPNGAGLISRRFVGHGVGVYSELDLWLSPYRRIASIQPGQMVRWLSDGGLLIRDGQHLFRLSDPSKEKRTELLRLPVGQIVSSADGHLVATLAQDGIVALFRRAMDDSYQIVPLQAPVGGARWKTVNIDDPGRYIMATGNENEVAVWSAEGSLVCNMEASGYAINDATLTNDGRLEMVHGGLSTGGPYQDVYIRSVEKCNVNTESENDHTIKGANYGLHILKGDGVAWLSDRSGLVQVLRQLGDINGETSIRLEQPTSIISSLAFRADHSIVATGAEDGTINFWNPENGQALSFVEGQYGRVTKLEFSPDGKSLASSIESGSQTIIWNVGDEITPIPVAWANKIDESEPAATPNPPSRLDFARIAIDNFWNDFNKGLSAAEVDVVRQSALVAEKIGLSNISRWIGVHSIPVIESPTAPSRLRPVDEADRGQKTAD